jgi:hypothetical protein
MISETLILYAATSFGVKGMSCSNSATRRLAVLCWAPSSASFLHLVVNAEPSAANSAVLRLFTKEKSHFRLAGCKLFSFVAEKMVLVDLPEGRHTHSQIASLPGAAPLL